MEITIVGFKNFEGPPEWQEAIDAQNEGLKRMGIDKKIDSGGDLVFKKVEVDMDSIIGILPENGDKVDLEHPIEKEEK